MHKVQAVRLQVLVRVRFRDSFGGAIIIDDPHKASEASSDTIRGKV